MGFYQVDAQVVRAGTEAWVPRALTAVARATLVLLASVAVLRFLVWGSLCRGAGFVCELSPVHQHLASGKPKPTAKKSVFRALMLLWRAGVLAGRASQ